MRCVAVLVATFFLGSAAWASALTDPLVEAQLVTPQQAQGADLFFRGTFGGNGRTCGTCHRVENNQTIDPPFIATLPGDDPLFVAENDPAPLGSLEKPILMRQFGLVLENVDGFSDPENIFVMRAVPHTLSLATSIARPPGATTPQLERTGWSGDGAPGDGSLLSFSAGAVRQHFTRSLLRLDGTDFVGPTPAEAAALEAYMRSVGRLNELNITSMTFTDPRASSGRDLFGGAGTSGARCRFCHTNAGANAAVSFDGGSGNHTVDTGVEAQENPARAIESFPLDGGEGLDLIPGHPASFGNGKFNVPPLIEAADTPPFFHNNSEATIEGAVRFYAGPFNDSAAAVQFGQFDLTEEQVEEIAAFLRVLNAGFNIAIARQRSAAAAALISKSSEPPVPCDSTGCLDPPPDTITPTVFALLDLANVEAQDALEVLDLPDPAADLNPTARARLVEAMALNEEAMLVDTALIRKQLILQAIAKLDAAKTNLGTGFNFQMGAGNLLF
ncbi:MAG TPA: hypothetical protein VFV75_06400 [Candidatus Polarisedimenticolaceae bacterium]|nr:hypothetical protein [Candidatus Polarisedimenticolaceae bacterium]